MPRKLLAEFLGTAILVLVGVGAAITGLKAENVPASGIVGVAAAFGLALFAIAYTFGAISGAHVNPAVSLGLAVSGRMPIVEMVQYWVAQVLGAIAGAFLLWGMVDWFDVVDTTGGLGTNGYTSLGGAAMFETIFTAVFVFVILMVTRDGLDGVASALGGAAIGLSLFMVHLVGIAVTGTSVNPARSIGPALFQGGEALEQLWVFIVFPLLGGVVAAVLYRVVDALRPPATV